MRQPRIRSNQYSVTADPPPPIGDWTPTWGVSVVVPAFGGQDKLDLTLASLSAQTYPDELTEVIVVDDGSEPPLRLLEAAPPKARLVRSDGPLHGSAHAVNAGVATATYDVILRLDADVITSRTHVEAHMRWHHRAEYLVVLGALTFAHHEAGMLVPAEVADAVAHGDPVALFDPDLLRANYMDETMAKTNNLVDAGYGAFRVGDGAAISFPRALFDRAGGLDDLLALGSDTEFSYRLAQRGAAFVYEPQARCWHLGLSQMTARKDDGRRFRTPFLAQRVPLLPDFRKDLTGQYRVPYVDVIIDVEHATFDDVKASTVSVLSGAFTDVAIALVGPWASVPERAPRAPLDDTQLDLRLIREAFSGDGRIRLVESVPQTSFPAPFRMHLPAGLVMSTGALVRLIETIEAGQYGLLLLPVPRDRMLPIARLERTAAVERALLLAEPGEDLEDVVHEVSGVYWLNGSEWAFTPREEARQQPTLKQLAADVDKWKSTAELRRRDLEKLRRQATEWRRAAETPLKARLRQAVKRRWLRLRQAVARRVLRLHGMEHGG